MARFRRWTTEDLKRHQNKVIEEPPPKKPRKKPEKKVNPYIAKIAEALELSSIGYSKEYRFCPGRMWRFDFVIGTTEEEIHAYKIAIEFNGGVFTGGRHTRSMGYVKDLDKINAAQVAGFRVLQFTSVHLEDSERGIGSVGVISLVLDLMIK